MFNFKKDRLKKKKSLGEGFYGEVFPYQKSSEDTKWVVKRTKAKKIEDLLRCLPEIVLGFSCDHPCIVPVKGYSIQPKDEKYYIHMKLPRMLGGNLAEELRRRKAKNLYYTESELVKHFYGLVSAVDYLHSKKIFHGDIKINNVLLDEQGNVKLSDIGSAKYVPDEDLYNPMTGAHGAENYKAPEIVEYQRVLADYNSKTEEEKKASPMKSTLKKDSLFLADSWSLGLTMLEICLLQPTKVNPYASLPLITESLLKKGQEARKQYQDTIMDLIFALLKAAPNERLQVSAVKKKLEDIFGSILTEELKEQLGFQKQKASDVSKSFDIFNERTKEILQVFENDKKAKEAKLSSFEENIGKIQKRLSSFNVEVDKIKLRKKQEVEEVSKKYETIIQDLKQENLSLLEKLKEEASPIDQISKVEEKNLEGRPRIRATCTVTFGKVSTRSIYKWDKLLEIKGDKLFEIKGDKVFSIQPKDVKTINEKLLQGFVQDMVQECSKELRWKDLDRLEISFPMRWKGTITDESLKILASKLGPQLSNMQHLVLNMSGWKQITDEGLKEFAHQLNIPNIKHLELYMSEWYITDEGLRELACQLGSKLTNIKHLDLDMYNWHQITDEGLENFSSQLLAQLASVEHLSLWIAHWINITDKGFKSFASQFGPKLKNLKSLTLDCTELNITKASLAVLATQICNNHLTLQELNLYFQGCAIIKSDKQNFGEQFKQIPKLTIS